MREVSRSGFRGGNSVHAGGHFAGNAVDSLANTAVSSTTRLLLRSSPRSASYQYILHGMNAAIGFSPVEGRYPETAGARATFDKIVEVGREAQRRLPPHRRLVEAIYRRG
jgi:hypothetical protein